MRKIALVLLILTLFATSCGTDTDKGWTRFNSELFSMIIPSDSTQTQEKSGVEFLSEAGKIEIVWRFDQFSRNNIPAKESGKSNPGEEIIESTTATLGNRKIWWNKTRERALITVRMVIPLELGTIRVTGTTNEKNLDIIEKSVRSIVIENEDYFFNSDS